MKSDVLIDEQGGGTAGIGMEAIQGGAEALGRSMLASAFWKSPLALYTAAR
jgi:hypothetical protein